MEITVFAGKYGEAPALKKEHALGLFISTAEHNCMFDFGFLPGDNRFTPVFVNNDQLLCLPEPFTPL